MFAMPIFMHLRDSVVGVLLNLDVISCRQQRVAVAAAVIRGCCNIYAVPVHDTRCSSVCVVLKS